MTKMSGACLLIKLTIFTTHIGITKNYSGGR